MNATETIGTWTVKRTPIKGGVRIRARCTCGDGKLDTSSVPASGAEKVLRLVVNAHRCAAEVHG